MRTNTAGARPLTHTHEGGRAKTITHEQSLRRSVLACLLWEDTFYEDGVSIAERIRDAARQVEPIKVAALAVEARTQFRLRHVSLFLVRELVRHPQIEGTGNLVAATLRLVIERADELAEFMSLYWADGKQPLTAQVKKGLAAAVGKFDEYQLAKYYRSKGAESRAVTLRDVLRLTHPKPVDDEQSALWKRAIDGDLKVPDTWEQRLSSGEDKKEVFTGLIKRGRLGYMALLRNLRNMRDAGVDRDLVAGALLTGAPRSRALPFRFIAAAKACPGWEDLIEKPMLLAMGALDPLPGKTAIVVDCSGSMGMPLSRKSEMKMFDAAAALAILVREIGEEVAVYAYGTDVKQVPPRHGFALRDALFSAGVGHATNLGHAINTINADGYDRAIVVTDEQSRDDVPDPVGRHGYVINVAPYANGVGYGPWHHVDGWSEQVIRWISESERA